MVRRRPATLAVRLLRDTRGATFLEYVILLGLVGLLAIVGFRRFGNAILAATHRQSAVVALLEGDGRGSCLGGLCTGGACFVAGTPVATADGLRAIERIVAGDRVLSRDERTGETRFERVVRTFVTEDRPVVDVDFDRGDPVRATPGHLF